MPGAHEIGFNQAFTGAASGSKNIAATATGVVLIATTGLRLFRNVPDEHVGVVKHLGRGKRIKDSREISLMGKTIRQAHKAGETYGIKPAGSRRVIPIVQSMTLVSTGINNQSLGHFEFDTADNDQMASEAWINWHIMPDGDHAWRSIYNVTKPEELGQRLRSHAIRHLSYVLTGMTVAELRKPGELENNVRNLCTPIFEHHGTYLDSVDLQAPVQTHAQKQLNGMEMRAQAETLQAQNLGRIATYLESNGMAIPAQYGGASGFDLNID
ncbi:MAG: SPFH domain-containing protein [Candidatus Saccharimonadales bacterium]